MSKRIARQERLDRLEVENCALKTQLAALQQENAQLRLLEAKNNHINSFKQTEQAEHLLAKAGKVLASSLEYTDQLSNVAWLIVPHLADWCAVDLFEEDWSVCHVAVAHMDPAKLELAHELQQRYPPRREILLAGAQPWLKGQSELYPEITEAMLEAGAQDAEHFQILRDLNLRSAMVVPLVARERVMGLILFVWAESDRRYDEKDLALAEELAHRAALAVDNARLYREAQQLNAELEQRVANRTAELRAINLKLENEIAERQRTQAELTEVQCRLMEGREAERLYLAQELHDGPVQELYGVVYNLSGLAQSLIDEGDRARFIATRELVQQVIQELRTMAGELRPPTLAPFGLEKAISAHIDQFRQAHPELEVQLESSPDGITLPEPTRLALFRIYQAALNNVARHAEAGKVSVRFSFDPTRVRLEVRDNGRGFEVPQRWVELVRQGHLGLVGMVERAEAIGGEFNVQSGPGQGTLIRVVVPRQKAGE